MHCKKCSGPVYVDIMYDNETFVDVACFMCGKRWHITKRSVLGRYIRRWLIKDSSLMNTFTE
jgi:hypothetical protein